MRAIARGLQEDLPIGLAELVELLKPITLRYSLKDGELSGYCEATLSNDGTVHFSGRVHANGASAQSYTVIISFPSVIDGITYPPAVADMVGTLGIILIPHRGHVGGTFSFDTRNSTWDETATQPRIAEHWRAVRIAVDTVRVKFGTFSGFVEVADGILNGATGFWVFGL